MCEQRQQSWRPPLNEVAELDAEKGGGMQLHLTLDEFELMKGLTEHERWLSGDPQAPITRLWAQLCVQERLKGRDLVEQGLFRNLQLGFDELEDLAAALNLQKNQLLTEITRMAEPVPRGVLERRLSVLNHLLEKLTEAGAMI